MSKSAFLTLTMVLAFVTSDKVIASDAAVAQRLYEKTKQALDSGNFKEAKSDLEILERRYKSSVAYESDEDGKVTFGQFVPKELKKVECFLKFETGANNPNRTSEEALKQLVAAIASQDKSRLDSLVSCDVSEGVPSSESDTTLQDKAVSHLLGNNGEDGYGYIHASSP